MYLMSKVSSQGTEIGAVGKLKMITQMTTQTTAIGLIHLYFLPRVQGPG